MLGGVGMNKRINITSFVAKIKWLRLMIACYGDITISELIRKLEA